MHYIILKRKVEEEKDELSNYVYEDCINILYSDPYSANFLSSDKILVVGTNIELNVLKELKNDKISLDFILSLNDNCINMDELDKSLNVLKNSNDEKIMYNSKTKNFWDSFFFDNKYSGSYEKSAVPKILITTGYLRRYGINGMNQTFHAPKRLEQIAGDYGIEFHLVGSLQNQKLWDKDLIK